MAGTLFSILSFTQFIFDFPSGVLSDLLGQKKVAIIGFFFSGIGYILFGAVSDFYLFVIIMVILGIGNGFLSGVIQTWFENNYQFLMKTDSDRGIYGKIMARIRSISFLISGFSLIVGSFIAFHYSRQIAFQLNGVICLLGGLGMIFLLNNFFESEPDKVIIPISNRVKNYFKLIKESVAVLSSDRLLLSTLIGIIIVTSALGSVFLRFLLLPIIFKYTLNDSLVGLSRSILLFVLAIDVFIISFFVKKFKKRYFPVFIFIYIVLFVSGLILLLIFLPPNGMLNITAISLIVIMYVFFDSFISEIGVNLQQRVLLDLIPAKYKNSVLSIFTSMAALSVTIFYSIIGIVIEKFQLIGGLAFVGIVGVFGCLFLVPVIFSARISPQKQPM